MNFREESRALAAEPSQGRLQVELVDLENSWEPLRISSTYRDSCLAAQYILAEAKLYGVPCFRCWLKGGIGTCGAHFGAKPILTAPMTQYYYRLKL